MIEMPSQEEIQTELIARRRARMSNGKVPTPILSPPQGPPRHYLFSSVERAIKAKQHVYMPGPSGSGKSKIAEQVAEALNLPYYAPPIGQETGIYQLFGYFNAAGEYVRTPIRQACEHGGVLHLEEIDFASAAVGTCLNALLANDRIGFPDATITRHPNFVIVASANTYGTGANAQYVGSQGLNRATLNRFVFIEIPYDPLLELSLATNKEWCRHVQQIRAKVEQLKLKHLITPRHTLQGSALLAAGFSVDQVEQMTIFAGLDEHTIQKINVQLVSAD